LRSYPAPIRIAQWDVPIILAPIVVAGDKDWSFNVNSEVDFLVALHQAQNVMTFQFADAISQVVMYDYQWLPEALDIDGNPRGIFYAQLREIVG
jgi:hypothetical protein